MSDRDACVTAIKAAAPGLSDDDVNDILSAMVRRERGMPNRAGDALRWMEVAKALSAEEVLRAQVAARAARINVLRRIEVDAAAGRGVLRGAR